MPSEWRYRNTNNRLHTVSFEELAVLVRTDVLNLNDEVQDKATGKWVELDSVIGLRQAVARLIAEESDPAQEPHVAGSSTSPPLRGSRRRRGRYSAASIVALLAIPLFVAWIVNQQLFLWRRFPPRSNAAPVERAYWFPVIGHVTLLEFTFLLFDVCVVLLVVAQFLRHRPNAVDASR